MISQSTIADLLIDGLPATPGEKAQAALIRYPRFNKLRQDIQLCWEMSQRAGEPQCIAIEGVPGVGKSTLVKSYSESFARHHTSSGTKVPVFYVETPSPATVKGVAAKLLDGLGDPAANHGTLWSMNSRLIHFIRACDVQMVILDDFHHLIDKETNRVLNKVSDWLKVLIKETNVPFLVVGIEGTVERILNANAQLSRLFALRETLQPFAWDSQRPETIREFAGFVAFAEGVIGLRLTDEIERLDLLYRLHVATDGIVGNVMNLLRYGLERAQRRHTEVLTLDDLAATFDHRLAKHVRRRNPFTQTNIESPSLLKDSALGTQQPHEPEQVSPSADKERTKR